MNIINGLSRNKFLYFSIAVAVLFSVAILINFNGSFVVTDPDGFYHIRHAWIYRTTSIFDTSFPWTQYSVTRTLGGDLWYGFHIFLIPFTFTPDLVWGIKIAGVAIAFIALFLYFIACYRLKLRMALFWPTILPFFSNTVLERLTVTRPHPISIGLNMVIFSFLVRGGAWPVFIFSFLAVFIHLNLFWVPILTLIVISAARLINKQPVEWKKALALLLGVLAGALLRPHPIATLQLNYIQLVYLSIQKMEGIVLTSGYELSPLNIFDFPSYLLIIFAVLAVVYVWLIKKHLTRIDLTDKIVMWVLMVLTALYLMLTVFFARRAMDFFVGYLLLFAGFNLTSYFKYELADWDLRASKLIKLNIVALIISLACYNGINLLSDFGKYLALQANPYGQKAAANWLEKNSKPGEIVFHLGWARFSELFFWNQKNYYISAMDPIFPFAYDQSLYWQSHFLSTGEGGEFTCSYRKCKKEEIVRTDDVLTKNFRASYVYITTLNNGYPGIYFYLLKSPKKYKKVFSDSGITIFKIISK